MNDACRDCVRVHGRRCPPGRSTRSRRAGVSPDGAKACPRARRAARKHVGFTVELRKLHAVRLRRGVCRIGPGGIGTGVGAEVEGVWTDHCATKPEVVVGRFLEESIDRFTAAEHQIFDRGRRAFELLVREVNQDDDRPLLAVNHGGNGVVDLDLLLAVRGDNEFIGLAPPPQSHLCSGEQFPGRFRVESNLQRFSRVISVQFVEVATGSRFEIIHMIDRQRARDHLAMRLEGVHLLGP